MLHNNKPFLNQIVMCDKKWILYNWQWLAQCLDWEKAPKHFPKPNLHQKWSWSLMFCCRSDPLQLSEFQWNHYHIWEVCSESWWDAPKLQLQPALVNRKSPILFHNSQLHAAQPCFKGWTNWDMMFCLICHIQLTSHQPTSTSSSILTTFCRENASTTSRRQKMLSKSSLILKHGFLCYRNKQSYFLLTKMCWL